MDSQMDLKKSGATIAISCKITTIRAKRKGEKMVAAMESKRMMAQTHVGSPSFSGLVFLFEELLDELELLLDVPLDSPVRSSKS